MKVCFVTKYPPIEGGVAASSFWLARELAARGNSVHVITNGFQVEAEHRVVLDIDDLAQLTRNPVGPGGGRVVVRTPDSLYARPHIIPRGRPDVTMLAGMAIDEISRQGLEVVYSHYLEPYAVAGDIAARATALPHVVQHAGSDLWQLARLRDYAATYRWVLEAAEVVLTDDAGIRQLAELDISQARCLLAAGGLCPREWFGPDGEAMDVEAVRRNSYTAGGAAAVPQDWNPHPLPADVPTIGLYGKIGAARGSYDLLAALALLRDEGLAFNLLTMCGGDEFGRFLHEAAMLGLRERLWAVPFQPPWRVPAFIRACDCVCYLERGFAIAGHVPAVPREILACGRCLVVSRAVVNGHPILGSLADRHDIVVVEDPRNHEGMAANLRFVLQDRQRAAAIGRRGFEATLACGGDEAGDRIEQGLRRAADARAPRGSPGSRPRVPHDADEVVRRAIGFPMHDIVARYVKDYGIDPALARRHERELKRYLALCSINPDRRYAMAGATDRLWHTFLIFTAEYQHFCREVAGRFLHHRPLAGGPSSQAEDDEPDTYPLFLADYEALFGEPAPPDIWPRDQVFEVVGWVVEE